MKVDWIRAITFGRMRSDAQAEEAPRQYDASLPEPALWCLGVAVAKVSLVVVVSVSLLLVSGQNWHIREAVDALIPDKAMKSFAGDAAPRRMEAVEKKIGADLGKVRSSAPSAKTFGLGSTRQQVRAAQGSPDRETEATWWYGNSEVYFISDRVAAWKVTAGSPLKTR